MVGETAGASSATTGTTAGAVAPLAVASSATTGTTAGAVAPLAVATGSGATVAGTGRGGGTAEHSSCGDVAMAPSSCGDVAMAPSSCGDVAVELSSSDSHLSVSSSSASTLVSIAALPEKLLKRPYFGLIADGVHVHPYAVAMSHAAHPKGVVLVTDGIAALGLPVGKHRLGTMNVAVKQAMGVEGTKGTRLRATLEGTETLAGAVLPLDGCVRNFLEYARCTAGEALEAGSRRAAELLGIAPEHGELEVGSRADMVVLDPDLNVVQTWVSGRQVFAADREG
jgi:hypothetical protein